MFTACIFYNYYYDYYYYDYCHYLIDVHNEVCMHCESTYQKLLSFTCIHIQHGFIIVEATFCAPQKYICESKLWFSGTENKTPKGGSVQTFRLNRKKVK